MTRVAFAAVFTGIVRERGRLVRRDGGAEGVLLEVEAPETAATTAVGDSIALDGCCLTAIEVADGPIAVHGVSLTIAALQTHAFDVALVPHTLAATTLGRVRPGDEVNLEADVLAKYVERLLPAG